MVGMAGCSICNNCFGRRCCCLDCYHCRYSIGSFRCYIGGGDWGSNQFDTFVSKLNIIRELSLGQFFTDTAIGAVTGIITYGAGEIFSAVGSGIGNALGYLKFNNKFVNSVSGFLSAVEIFSKGVNIVGGISVGIYLDEVINKALNRQDNLVERIKNNIQSTIFSEFLNFIKYIW